MAWMVSDYPEPPAERICKCPVCGDECEKLYVRKFDDEVLGCDVCVGWVYAEELEP